MITELFQKFLNIYLDDKEKYTSDILRPRLLSQYPAYNLIVNQIPQLLQSMSNTPLEKYMFKGSVGQSNMTSVPWIAVFDKSITTSAQDGYYIVYLFSSKMDGFYITLNQGWTQYRKQYGDKIGLAQIKDNTRRAKHILSGIQGFSFAEILINPTRTLNDGYEQGNIISKYYPSNKIPGDEELLDDLRNLIGIYRELKGKVGFNILDITDVLSEEEFQDRVQDGVNERLPTGKIPKRKKILGSASETWARDSNNSYAALTKANFTCENNSDHVTFLHPKGHMFMESHHLIPMEFQGDFEFSIDVPENIICLCPNCHRSFHHATQEIIEKLISKFFDLRKAKLKLERGIEIDFETLKKYYK